ncbi:MAG: helix-turn-helix domain-containing protein [archaeon]
MIETLQTLGLSKRESVCYLALLELGPARTGSICKKTRIPSSKIYSLLERLASKGLVSHVLRNNIRYYQAAHPKRLLHDLAEKKRKIEHILPSLLVHKQQHQSVELIEGQKALFTALTELIADARPRELYLVFSINEENKDKQANLFFRNMTLRRKEKMLDVRLLKNKKDYVNEKHTKVQIRYTSFSLPQGITIFRNHILLVTWQETPLAVHIESETIAGQMREFFLSLWKKAR